MNNKCKYSSHIHFREKIDFTQVGIEPTPQGQVSALPVRPPETISFPIAQQKLYAYKFHVLHHIPPSETSVFRTGFVLNLLHAHV